MNNLTDVYFKEISRIPLLSVEEERALGIKAYKGDRAAQKKLIEANLRFVMKVASKYTYYMELEDLINEGNLGLMHAATKYNPESNNNRFNTYAVWWITAYIQKAIRETSTGIRFPSGKHEEMKDTKWNFVRLDKAIKSDDEGSTLGSLIQDDKMETPEEFCLAEDLSYQLKTAIKCLKEKEQAVLTMRFGLDGKKPMSLAAVGEVIGYKKEGVRQIEIRAIKALKEILACYSNDFDEQFAA